MKRETKRSNWTLRGWAVVESVGAGSFALVLSLATLSALGGPLYSPDSYAFLKMAEAPLDYLGSWNPPGFPIVLYIFQTLHTFIYGFTPIQFSLPVTLGLIVAVRSGLIYFLLRKRWGRVGSILGVFSFFSPEWLQINSSVWSESTFTLWIVLIAWMIDQIKLPRVRTLAVAAVLPGLYYTRHAGIFLLPAIVLSLALLEGRTPILRAKFKSREMKPVRSKTEAQISRWIFKLDLLPKIKRSRFSMKALLLASAWVVLGCLITNFYYSGSVTHHVRQDSSCIQGLAAMSSFGYCDWGAAPQLCALDPDRRWINHVNVDHSQTLLNLNASGPLRQYAMRTDGCGDLGDVMGQTLLHQPLGLLWVWTKRLVMHFGPWDMTERGDVVSTSSNGPDSRSSVSLLDHALAISNSLQGWIYITLLFFGIFLIVFRLDRLSPVAVFLILGGMGHALGISINNPFYVVRYALISKMMLQLGVFLSVSFQKRVA